MNDESDRRREQMVEHIKVLNRYVEVAEDHHDWSTRRLRSALTDVAHAEAKLAAYDEEMA